MTDNEITISAGDPDDNRRALGKAIVLAQTRGQDAAGRGLMQWDGPTTTVEIREPWEVLDDAECLRAIEWLARSGRKAGVRLRIDTRRMPSVDAFRGSPVLMAARAEGRL